MSSHQATLDGFATDEPDRAPEPDTTTSTTPTVDGIPNFNRERGREITRLGAGLGELCENAHEYEATRQRGRHRSADIGGAE